MGGGGLLPFIFFLAANMFRYFEKSIIIEYPYPTHVFGICKKIEVIIMTITVKLKSKIISPNGCYKEALNQKILNYCSTQKLIRAIFLTKQFLFLII